MLRRPDLVLYVNEIAIGVVELKNSRVSVGNPRRTGKALVVREHKLPVRAQLLQIAQGIATESFCGAAGLPLA